VQSAGDEAAEADAQLRLVFNRPVDFVSKPVLDRVDAIVMALKDSTRVSDNQVLALANNPPDSGAEFTKMLELYRDGKPSFSNADAAVARFGLTQAVHVMEGSDAVLSAWEQRLELTPP